MSRRFLSCLFAVGLMIQSAVWTEAQAPPDLTTLHNYSNPFGSSCSIDGNPNSSAAKKASNRLKNRFTIPGSTDSSTLRKIKDLPFTGENGDKPSIDEQAGMSPVSVVGYVVAVSYGGNGESCNCKATDKYLRDAHIDLVLYPNEEMADTLRRDFVVVEVTERSRRLAKGGFLQSNIGNNWSTSVLQSRLKGRWVRFTGYMFYDDDHHFESWNVDPDNNVGRPNWRATSWEVHPVIGIEVLNGRPAGIPVHKPDFQPDNFFVMSNRSAKRSVRHRRHPQR